MSILEIVVGLEGPLAYLLEGRLGSNSYRAFRFVFLLARAVVRQELQVANTLPDLLAGKQESRRFWLQEEQYLESILNVRSK